MVGARTEFLYRAPTFSILYSIARRNIFSYQALHTSGTSSARSIEVPTSHIIDEQDSFPIIEKCPSPTCQCAEMPADLDIDYKKSLRGTMPYYTRHVVIRTGQSDWESRIEGGTIGHEQQKGANLARELKELIGPKGKYHDPHKAILVSNSSLGSRGRTMGRDVLVYPEGISVCNVGETPEGLEAFVEQVLMSPKISLAQVERAGAFQIPQNRSKPRVFICGHNNRDRRCGVLGPLLQDEFLAWSYKHATVNRESATCNPAAAHSLKKSGGIRKAVHSDIISNAGDMLRLPFGVGLISHIGGHAWAGNVILYLPPAYRLADGTISPLAGKGVWYGRVEPKHVEGIVDETIRRGRLIEELLRGVHSVEAVG